MNDSIYFYLGFTASSVTGYLIARWASVSFSGDNYTTFKFWIAFSYAMTLCFIHYRFAETGVLPYFGHTDNSVMGWLSLVLVFIHPCLLPVRKRKKWRSRGKRFDLKLHKHTLTLDRHRLNYPKKPFLLSGKEDKRF